MTKKKKKKWGQIQRKWDFAQVSREFELTKFELAGFVCILERVIQNEDSDKW